MDAHFGPSPARVAAPAPADDGAWLQCEQPHCLQRVALHAWDAHVEQHDQELAHVRLSRGFLLLCFSSLPIFQSLSIEIRAELPRATTTGAGPAIPRPAAVAVARPAAAVPPAAASTAAVGPPDTVSRLQGLLPQLHAVLAQRHAKPAAGVIERAVVLRHQDFYMQMHFDRRWGCGYRNIQVW